MSESLQPKPMTVNELFNGRLFNVPDYQRSYAWEQKQLDDLWEDIREVLRTDMPHFLGTVVLMKQTDQVYDSEGRPFQVCDVVDGQQRITTICLFLLAVYDILRIYDNKISIGLWRDFVQHEDNIPKLQLGGLNKEYFDSLVSSVQLNNTLPEAQRSSDERLRKAVRRFQNIINAWIEAKDVNLNSLASCVREKLQVLYFVTDSQALAIKTFQSVNDRGKDLSLLDKSKSFLMFYLTRYCPEDTEALRYVEKTFGQVFDNYDEVCDLARKYDVDYLLQPQFRFSEDEFLRYAYHYSFYDFLSRFGLKNGYEYNITPESIFESFLKSGCHALKEKPKLLRSFILDWCQDLQAVSDALVQLLNDISISDIHKRLFQFQDPSATIYPLLVGAKTRGFLDQQMLQAISILDLRVYQVRGTDPKAGLYNNAVAAMKSSDWRDILKSILDFCLWFGSDQELNNILRGHVYKQNFTKFVLWNFLIKEDSDVHELDYQLYSYCQVEHVFPQDPSTFDIDTFGFANEEDYEANKHTFGNLTLLEHHLNPTASHRPPSAKCSIYNKSKLNKNKMLAQYILDRGFRIDHLNERTAEIVQFFKREWPIPTVSEQ